MTEAPTAEALADELAARHRDWFRQNPMGELAQTCLIFGEDGAVTAVECGWANPVEREITIALLRMLMERAQAVRYALWAETWMVQSIRPEGMDPQEFAKRESTKYAPGSLATHPDRIECVLTYVVEASGKSVSRTQRIIRGRSGGVRTLVPEDIGDGMAGALTDLLPHRTFN